MTDDNFEPSGPFANWSEGIVADIERREPGWRAQRIAAWNAWNKTREQ